MADIKFRTNQPAKRLSVLSSGRKVGDYDLNLARTSDTSEDNFVLTRSHNSHSVSSTDSQGKLLQSTSVVSSLHAQTLFINFDRDDERVYKAYFRRQRLGVLPVLVALATVHAVLCVSLDLLPYYRVDVLDRLVVISGSACGVVLLFVVIHCVGFRDRITETLAVVMWVILTFQIFYDVGSTYPHHMPSDRLGWLLVHIFITQMSIHEGGRVSIPVVCLLVLIHSVLVGVLWGQTRYLPVAFANQIAANVLMSLGSACMGFAGGLFLDRLNRRSVLETKSAMSAKAKIELAYRNKERLLLSVLPKCVADEMLKDVGNLADGQFRKIYMSRYENVSILFADIVGFTAISSTVTAAELVKILNELFASFDVLANKFHQVRIKILGDCYYCVCGALEPRPDHAVLAIHMGLSMVDAISAVRQKTGKDVNMRVGVHTGACLGGVLGQRQWQFDVLGKEVTLANKMESGGLPARVHISEATRLCLNGEFDLEEGHGEEREEELRLKNVKTYLVKSVVKPYPEGTLDMPTTPTRQISNGFHRNKRSSSQSQTEQGDESERDEVDGDTTGSGEEEYKKEFSLKLQRELLAKEKDSKLLETFQPLTLNFKDKALEVRFQQRSDSYSGLPVVALSVALVLMFVAKLCISPRTLTTVLIYLGGVIILAAMGVVSMTFTFAQRFPKSVVRFAMSVEKHAVLKLLWGFTGCVVFFLCDAVPVFQCEQRNITIDIKNGSHISTDDSACFYIVYYTHGANLILIAISSMVNLGHVVKGVLIFLVTGSHCLIVLLGVDGTYGNYNRVLYEEEVYPHIKYRLLGQMIASAVALNFFNFQLELTTRKLYLWKEESKKEKEKAADLQVKNEALVYNLMPAHVAKDFLGRRKKDSELYSHSYEETGVMFAACPNFHAFYNESSINNNGLECLRFLNEIISDYDELLNLAKFSTIVKIKTVGPTYMAASGMVAEETKKQVSSIKERWSHLHDLVQFAHALQDVIKKINEQSFNNFILRIGINHGPIIAGVIGARKPHYDIWGNTVNVSSRMESTGQAGRIQVVEETKNILEVFGYTFEKRGLIKVKGKGELMTYFLERQVDLPDMHMPNQVPET